MAYPSEEVKQKLAADIPSIWLNSEKVLEHPVSKQLYSIAERIDTVYMLLGDVLDQYKNSPQKLKPFFPTNQVDSRITAAYDKRYLSLKSRLLRLAIFSTLSVFLSNWVTFLLLRFRWQTFSMRDSTYLRLLSISLFRRPLCSHSFP